VQNNVSFEVTNDNRWRSFWSAGHADFFHVGVFLSAPTTYLFGRTSLQLESW